MKDLSFARSSRTDSKVAPAPDEDEVDDEKKEEEKEEEEGPNNALGIFSLDNPIRIKARELLAHPQFDNMIVAVIITSSLALALEDPLADPDAPLLIFLANIDIFFSAIFILEAILKIIAAGFITNGPKSYLLDGWNKIDFTIVVVSLLGWFVELSGKGSAPSWIKAVRTVRVLKPLRLTCNTRALYCFTTSPFAIKFSLQHSLVYPSYAHTHIHNPTG